MLRKSAVQKLPIPDNIKTLNASNAFNSDIIQAIESAFSKAKEQTAVLSKHFKKSTREETAKAVWDFLKHQMKYERDADGSQLVRLPSRFVRGGVGDCKSFSLFAASILANLGFPVAFRYASYSHSAIPTHVYVVTSDETGKPIIVDGVWHSFNSEKAYRHKIDHVMNVYTLSGVEGEEIGKIRLKKFFKKAFKGLKKFGLALPRRAFRTLVAVNAGGLASKLARGLRKNPNAIFKKWKQLGGSEYALKKSISKGARRKRIGAIDPDSIGAAAGLPAILAAAAPIIAAIVPLLKSLGVDKEAKQGEGTLDKIENAAQKASSMAAEATGGKSFSYSDPTENPTAYDTEPTKSDEPSGFSLSPTVLIGGAAVLYLITRKK